MRPPDGGSGRESPAPSPAAPSSSATARRWLRRLLAVVPVLLFLSFAAWAVATPLGSAPDEDFHLASIWCGLGDRPGLCEPGATHAQEKVPAAFVDIACFKGHQSKTADCQHLDDTHLVATTRLNSTGIYPPIFYAVTGVFASTSLAASVIAIRLFNAAIFVALGTVLFAMLPRERRASLVLTWAGALVPLGLFLVPSANPSSWAVSGCVSAWFAAIGFFESTGRKRIWFGVVTAVSCVLAAGSRADAAVYAVLAVCAAWFLTHHPTRGRRLTALWLPLVVIAVGVVVVVFAGQSGTVLHGVGGGATSTKTPQGFDLLFQNLTNVPMLWVGTLGAGPLGALGWFDIPLPYATQAGAFAAYLGMLAWGLRDGAVRRLIVMALWVAVLIVVPLWVLQQSGETVGTYLQPRYLYPAVLLLVAAAVTVRRGFVRFSGAQFAALGAAATLAASAALYGTIRRFSVADPSVETFSLGHPQKWWWGGAMPGPMTVWVLGSLVFALTVAITLAGVGTARTSAPQPRPEPPGATRPLRVPRPAAGPRHAAHRRAVRLPGVLVPRRGGAGDP